MGGRGGGGPVLFFRKWDTLGFFEIKVGILEFFRALVGNFTQITWQLCWVNGAVVHTASASAYSQVEVVQDFLSSLL